LSFKNGTGAAYIDIKLTLEELAAHAADISATPVRKAGRRLKGFPAVLDEKEMLLEAGKVYSTGKGEPMPPAATLLWDNLYLLEEKCIELEDDLTSSLCSALPTVAAGPFKGLPRSYWLAHELVTHTEGRPTGEAISAFLSAFSKANPVMMIELWSMPLMLKLVLIKLCRSVAQSVAVAQKSRRDGERWARLVIKSANKPDRLIALLKNIEPDAAFAEGLYSQLNRSGTGMTQAADRLMRIKGLDADRLIRSEHRTQMQYQLLAANAISTLRELDDTPWEEMFESISAVEAALRQDDVYRAMDFESRHHYRRRVQAIARELKIDETLVAETAVALAKEGEGAKAHSGWYLFKDSFKIAQRTGCVAPQKWKTRRALKKAAFPLYMLSIFIPAALMVLAAAHFGALYAVLFIIPAIGIAQALVSRVAAAVARPDFLAKLELEDIGEEHATMIVVPALLSSMKRATDIVAQIEACYLANPGSKLYFALLGDYKDGQEEHVDTDKGIFETAEKAIIALNKKYPAAEPVFYYYQRERIWNETDSKFMGRERKRGALEDLNQLLLGKGNAFIQKTPPPKVKYVITLDADTRLSMGGAAKLIGAISHPLNAPVLEGGKVVSGYGILQPRIGLAAGSGTSFFSRVFSGRRGWDLYMTSVSDVYQDVFGQGIFTGKGIYELEAFSAALDGWVPENRVLSHDLLEGCFAGAGFVSDIELVDGFPSAYASWADRQHRWIRGDWQLLGWLMPKVRKADGQKVPNPLSALCRWKIADNLRRSLHPIFVFLILAASVFIEPIAGLALAAAAVFIHALIDILTSKRPGEPLIRGNATLTQAAISIVLMPYEAYLSADAIIRTLIRLWRRRRMLEWVTAADAERKDALIGYYKRMWFAPFSAVLIIAIASISGLITPAAFICVTWAIAPYAAWKMSEPEQGKKPLSGKDEEYIRTMALKSWRFFEEFAVEQYGYLAPDNVQVQPRTRPVTRTSPTNMGFSMLGTVSAYNMGFIGYLEMLERISGAANEILRMEKWNGHLYNWYDLKRQKPLEPYYVSTVDSGNLCACLMACAEALKQGLRRDIRHSRAAGLSDWFRCFGAAKAKAGIEKFAALSEEAAPSQWRAALRQSKGGGLAGRAAAKALDEFDMLAPWIKPLSDQALRRVCGDKVKVFALRMEQYLSLQAMANKHGSAMGEFDAVMTAARKDNSALRAAKVIQASLMTAHFEAAKISRRAEETAELLNALAREMDFSRLYSKRRRLFHIGHDAGTCKDSASYYDLLASEARLSSFVAIAKGDVTQKHWFSLGRSLTGTGRRALVSWGGTMFEYLMPMLLLKSYNDTLLDEAVRAAVSVQKAYGDAARLPWGVSESGYYAFDLNMNYQYKAFGDPRLGLKPGLYKDTVIAPYATFLSLMVDAPAAVKNLYALKREGAEGEYGFYEAIDYTPSRTYGRKQVIKSFMAHHIGMSLCAIDNTINSMALQKLFHSIPAVRAAELLLQERVPSNSVRLKEYIRPLEEEESAQPVAARRLFTKGQRQAHFISNGAYSVMLTPSGTGESKLNDIIIARGGRYFGVLAAVKNVESGALWHIGHMHGSPPKAYHAVMEADRASISRQDGTISTRMDICVSPEANAEVRVVTLMNTGETDETLDITMWFEPVMTTKRDFDAHPAFNKLFLEASHESGVLLLRKRPRGDEGMWLGFYCDGAQYETGRARFIGRTESPAFPKGLDGGMSGNTVSTDVIMCLRKRVNIKAGESVKVPFVIAAGGKEQALEAAAIAKDAERAFEMAFTQAQVESQFLALSGDDITTFQALGGRIMFDRRPYDCEGDGIGRLHALGISGDYPIVAVRVANTSQLGCVFDAARAHEYLKMKGLDFDLVIVDGSGNDYYNPVREKLAELTERRGAGRPVFVVKEFPKGFAEATGGFELNSELPLKAQVEVLEGKYPPEAFLAPKKRRSKLPELMFDNGFGGFDGDGYVIYNTPPAPWAHIMGNGKVGALVTDNGGCTWASNAREEQITKWYNDAVTDPPAEAVYIKSGESVWRMSVQSGYARYSPGVAEFVSFMGDDDVRMTVFVHDELPVKLYWVTSDNDGISAQFVARMAARGIKANAGHNGIFMKELLGSGGGIGFISAITPDAEYSLEINELLPPFASSLSGGAACGVRVAGVRANVSKGVLFAIGACSDEDKAISIIETLKGQNPADMLKRVKEGWLRRLGILKIRTPDPAMDVMINTFLPYQLLASRLIARSGFYQCGGAFGFRDQLQDVCALLYTDSAAARRHILLCAEHQFKEGDVQHWWHPPRRGVRTKISDDYLWLPWAVCEYVRITGDMSLLDEEAAFLEGSMPEHKDVYEEARVSEEKASVLEHCIRAVDRVSYGQRGLPLIMGGDWNDGMDEIGEEGKGESVWLAWFLLDVFRKLIPILAKRGDARQGNLMKRAMALEENIEKHAWQGDRYLRAWYDDGTPVGAAGSPECAIDLISQAWAAIAGRDTARAAQAMDTARENLLDEAVGTYALLAPPFDGYGKPGYIMSYIPGVRENGGQYTHAASWAVIAMVKLGQKDALDVWNIINPVNHAKTRSDALRYAVEPYVIAADVYAGQNPGRGGWTWYTGSAGWMWRAAVEWLLGIKINGGNMTIEPCLGGEWDGFEAVYKPFSGSEYHITVKRGEGALTLNGKQVGSAPITEGVHLVEAFFR
jgi:cyclic beta-1,2-glucan synthetase